MADPIDDAEQDVIEQAKWGMSRTDETVAKLVSVAKAQRARLVELEDHVQSLNARVKALEDA